MREPGKSRLCADATAKAVHRNNSFWHLRHTAPARSSPWGPPFFFSPALPAGADTGLCSSRTCVVHGTFGVSGRFDWPLRKKATASSAGVVKNTLTS